MLVRPMIENAVLRIPDEMTANAFGGAIESWQIRPSFC